MAFIIDDLINTSGLLIVGQNWSQFFNRIHDAVKEEIHDLDKINNKIKTNRMLYEYGEITKEKYEKINAGLMQERKTALKARGMDVGSE